MILFGTLRLLHDGLDVAREPFRFIDPWSRSLGNIENEPERVVRLNEEELARGRIGRVFRGQLEDSSSILHVVVKLVAPTSFITQSPHGARHFLYSNQHRKRNNAAPFLLDLAHEARIYASSSPGLRSLQGSIVPLCIGYAVNERATSACLILEDAGDALPFPYKRLPLPERRTLYELQVKLHEAGVSHGDVARRNFVKSSKGIRLIDFDRASFHKCPRFSVANNLNISSGTMNSRSECAELERWFRLFGLYLAEDDVKGRREGFVPWDGRPWGEDVVSDSG
ncbi:uncharacterized protein EI90DRAFT_848103 [Cantharellus anzutake]|uniref:uncharacterized protein n=1 Tax=Cantharellus anzutake TaxID=1750568 RepID=UPI0019081B5A|nr:uncharacterized protein EI90DRAFT_848103 [Cantharellus anzutake]KAF8332334.1 hypothetical protein EI90DRAFT_848103 [Cantharellus anzutake]